MFLKLGLGVRVTFTVSFRVTVRVSFRVRFRVEDRVSVRVHFSWDFFTENNVYGKYFRLPVLYPHG